MHVAGSNQYHLSTLWQFDAPLEAVWDAIFHAEAWPSWWKGVECVVTLEHGDANGLGARQRYTWKSALPYRLTFVTRVTRVEPLRRLEGSVEGDLEGIGCWHLGRDADLTTVRFDWQVRTTLLWMNLLAPLAKPLFRWNHHAIMRAGGIGLAQHLKVRLRSQMAWAS
ncbi:SRPBCC family protein [Pseudomonas sp. 2FE]|uniref:SRPBCC family protein n=1 Tax=Pseudomonas sp. 2FE TaxID=2502190 RepID=UPI0010FA5D37|nr:SRPBCC family protein [Pseudomonas sp. 2FE]